jgi:hypothetical protein
MTKWCPDCQQNKKIEDFHANRRRPDGLAYYCKECAAARSRDSYARRQARSGRVVRAARVEMAPLPEGTRRCLDCDLVKRLEDFPRNRNDEQGRHTYCKPCHNARGAETRQRLYGGSRHYHLMRRYGISAAQADAMLEEQDGLCAICQERPAEHVDHDHETGAVRGLLCFNCNGGLGQFRDRVDILKKAIAYLERTRDSQWQTSDCTDGSLPPTRRRGPAPSPTSYEQLHLSC